MRSILGASAGLACSVLALATASVFFPIEGSGTAKTGTSTVSDVSLTAETVEVAMDANSENVETTIDPEPVTQSTPETIEPETAEFNVADLTVEQLATLRSDALEQISQVEQTKYELFLEGFAAMKSVALRPEADLQFAESERPVASQLRESCAQGDADACAGLSGHYMFGQGVLQDQPLGAAIAFLACEEGADEGCIHFHNWENISQYDYEGPYPHVGHFAQRCAEGNGEFCYLLGFLTKYGLHSVVEDESAAQSLFAQSCELAYPMGCAAVGESEKFNELVLALCGQDDAEACYSVGRLHERGQFEGISELNALSYYRLSCDLEPGYACTKAARILTDGESISEDLLGAFNLLERACIANHSQSCVDAAGYLVAGTVVPQDLDGAQAYLETACIGSRSYEHCAELRELAPDHPLVREVSHETIKAEVASLNAAEGPLAAALSDNLDMFHPSYYGQVQRVRTECAADDARSCIYLAHYLYGEYSGGGSHGLLYDAVNRPAARAVLERACDLGNAQGCYEWADSYMYIGEETDLDSAFPIFERACDMDHAAACHSFATFYEDGTVVEEDFVQAGELYSKSCALGADYGCHRLGSLWDIEDEALFLRNMLESCVNGQGNNCERLAQNFEGGHYGLSENAEVTTALLQLGCELQNERSCAAISDTN